MLKSTDDLRITEIKPLTTPIEVMRQHPRTDAATRTVRKVVPVGRFATALGITEEAGR